MFAALSRHFWPVDDEEPAVQHLASHFEKAISQIVKGCFMQLPHTRMICKELLKQKKKTFFLGSKDCSSLWSSDLPVTTQWLGEKNLWRKLQELRNKVIFLIFHCKMS